MIFQSGSTEGALEFWKIILNVEKIRGFGNSQLLYGGSIGESRRRIFLHYFQTPFSLCLIIFQNDSFWRRSWGMYVTLKNRVVSGIQPTTIRKASEPMSSTSNNYLQRSLDTVQLHTMLY